MSAATPVFQRLPLGPLWPTLDPFLFCAHHHDAYPASDGALELLSVWCADGWAHAQRAD